MTTVKAFLRTVKIFMPNKKPSSITIGFLVFLFIPLQSIESLAFVRIVTKHHRQAFYHYQTQIRAARIKRKMNQVKLLPTGIWGGSGVLIRVEKSKIGIEYACANGEITGPLKIDRNGNFTAEGVHIQPRPGPLRANEKGNRQPARFEGKISGKNMRLRVILIKTNELIGDFELAQDVMPRIRRCM